MDQITLEKYVINSPEPVSIDGTEKILFQMKNCICKIHKSNGVNGTGFFCKIPFNHNSNLLPVLITNNHIIDENDIKQNKKIYITINDEKESRSIIIDNSKKTFTSPELDVTIIEINILFDKIYDFLEIDESIQKEQNFIENTFMRKSIFVLHYPKGKNINVSYGLLPNIKNKFINHLCTTDNGSSGSPILLLDTFKVIGIHCGSSNQFKYNKGIFIKYALNEFIKNNETTKLETIFETQDFNVINIEEFLSKYKNQKEFDILKTFKEIQVNLMNECRITKYMLDSRGNKCQGWGIGEKRGRRDYIPPIGWIGFGLKVSEKFDDGNDDWLGNKNGIGEWCVAYHGIGYGQNSPRLKETINNIMKKGLLSGPNQMHKDCDDLFHPGKKVGIGVYCCQDIKVAENYAGIIEINKINYKVVLMLRVKSDKIRACSCLHSSWVLNGIYDEIRGYRILLKEC